MKTKPPQQYEVDPCDSLSERVAIMLEANPGWSEVKARSRAQYWDAWCREQTRKGQRDLKW